MPYTLKSFEDYGSADAVAGAVDAIQELTHDKGVAALLKIRHLHRVLRRYDVGREEAQSRFRQTREKQAAKRIGAFAIVNEQEEIQGLATILPMLQLSKLRLPLPPKLAFGTLRRHVSVNGPDVSVWTAETSRPVSCSDSPLFIGYRELLGPGGPVQQLCHERELADKPFAGRNAWRIESNDVADWVHQAVVDAGLVKRGAGYFDDSEPAHIPVAFSNLYTRNHVQELGA